MALIVVDEQLWKPFNQLRLSQALSAALSGPLLTCHLEKCNHFLESNFSLPYLYRSIRSVRRTVEVGICTAARHAPPALTRSLASLPPRLLALSLGILPLSRHA